jgi:exodeoxyribonuclease VII small subunit
MSIPNTSLEDSLAEITTLIDHMEKDELTLEQSLSHFERGIFLIKHCQKILTEAEQKVQILMQTQQQETLVPFQHLEKNEVVDANTSR